MKKTLLIMAIAAMGLNVSAQEWAPAGETIRTRWAKEVTPGNALPEYPRPQMVRNEWMNLNGLWDYSIQPIVQNDFRPQGKILVPFVPESSLSGVCRRVGSENRLWYERKFSIPKNWKGKNVILHFGAVDWKAQVYVNDFLAGEHTGGYTPFSYDITPYLSKNGEQTLKVVVWDGTDEAFQPRGKQVNNPTSIWYTPVTGIWQTVWLEPVCASHIESYYAVSDIDAGTISVSVDAAFAKSADTFRVELLEGGIGYSAEKPSESVIASSETDLCSKAVIKVPEVRTWSPDSPYIYGLKVSLLRNGKVVDSVNGYTTMRKISIIKSKDDYLKMALNGNPLFQYGPLDQGWWPDGLYTAPTDEALRFDIVKTKDFGFNMIRKHIKVEPARWFYWCDVEGMLVWQDMPSIADHSRVNKTRREDVAKGANNVWSTESVCDGTDIVLPQEWKDNYYKEWKEIMESVKVFNCVVVWVPFNEAWGQFDTEKVTEFTRAQDPTRLINPASGGNHWLCGDILDVHNYPGPSMKVMVRKQVNVLGEYGGIGYPIEGHLWQKDKNWGYGAVKTSGEEVLAQYEEFAKKLSWYVANNGWAAAVYTQTTDVEIEVNGLMTYDREIIKVDEARLAEINKSVINSMSKE